MQCNGFALLGRSGLFFHGHPVLKRRLSPSVFLARALGARLFLQEAPWGKDGQTWVRKFPGQPMIPYGTALLSFIPLAVTSPGTQ
ncbi:hypothetical protein DC20_21400 (plasmid) [Rufibacter tibetensis]|uniref:Uncharacterized protein n=1 Tax=Rufibacter tibetensis TaxID=512763 RepID=A0A0P0CD53_9BACT|nr:hypothetical protein DC20_21400 [Rufibacter tibetensis]